MSDRSDESVTMDDIELIAWRTLGAKDAAQVDRLLKAVQAYADEQTKRAQARTATNYVMADDGSMTEIVPVAGGLDRLLDPGNSMLDVVRYTREEANRIAGIREDEKIRRMLAGEGAERGGGPKSVEKSMLFEGGGSKSVEKSMLFTPGQNSETTGKDEGGDSDTDFLDMLRDVVAEGKAEKETIEAGDVIQICSRCRKGKPLEAFSRDSTKVSGRRSHCKACVVERNAEIKREKARRDC